MRLEYGYSDPRESPSRRNLTPRPANVSGDLPYLIELSDEERQAVEQVLAATARPHPLMNPEPSAAS